MNKNLIYLFVCFVLLSCSSKETVPIYDYYKNIPIIRGWTSDPVQKNYMIEVVLVYREGNGDLQTKINLLKPPLIDALRGYLSSLKEDDFTVDNQPKLKSELVERLNNIILDSMAPKSADKLREITDLEKLDLLLDLNIMQLQIFNLN